MEKNRSALRNSEWRSVSNGWVTSRQPRTGAPLFPGPRHARRAHGRGSPEPTASTRHSIGNNWCQHHPTRGSTVMALSLHRHRTADRAPASTATAAPTAPADTAPADTAPPTPEAADTPHGSRVYAVQRTGAFVVAGVIAVFGILGLANGLAFFSTD